MSLIYRLNETTYRVFVKGAPDWLHQYTTSYLDKFGNIQQINEDFENSRDKQIKNYADHALRTLLLCYKDVPVNELNADVEDLEYLETQLEKQLIVIGVVGIQDPLRPEVEGAVRTCQNAGVTVRVFTGDSADSAIAISKNAGIIEKNYDPNLDKHVVMTGPEFSEFVGGRKEIKDDKGKIIKYEIGNLEKFKIVYEKTRVIARSSPEDKYLLVTGIRQLGHVVAVTGDGTNDAPALKKADVGFAWNIQGTQVAKEASDIIVLNDSFNSIVAAILQGKHNLDCIRKFLYFQVVLNIVAILMVTLSAIALRESPLGLLQVVWINVFVSSFIIYAQIWEKPQESLIKTKPQGKFEAMITPNMWRNIIGQGIWQIFVLLVVLFKGAEIFSIPTGIHNEHWTQENEQHYTIFFNIFVYMQVFNEINARKLNKEEKNVFSGFFINPFFLIVIIFTIFVQILLTTYGGLAAGCSDLTMHQHIVCLVIGASSLIVGYLIKLLPEACFNSIFLFRNFEKEGEEEKQDSQFKLESSKDKNI
ncbi:P-type ATPase, cytoplasmic domain N [Pseudocohnilembus persalinus]|uniref:P-type ATPase, cytoplasmic domain N n=1 Tax=Pseudocohnilembus persalinus TaxID=266149 RepID=A0A0V0R6T8_PSEPJ|nr:P-type ATPase, cytoplasmic domain N [Pseudocohnilembus persalinus]|eukprot:KRX10194.1 P-type ATPase, cytoplasmic domain N [Pseudocohnilembus persalinus]